ncbi:hypothetical protein B484DRAFT_440960, partial [Ochromonadaceae sp. CCMP2298]
MGGMGGMMQKHSNHIKETLTSASIKIEDPKARNLVLSVAAEAMRKALLPLLSAEIRRGFIAWGFVVRQQRRREKAGYFIRFLTLRNVCLGLDKMLLKVLRYNWRVWREVAAAETLRLKKQRVLNAVTRIQGVYRRRKAVKRVALLRQRRKYQQLYDSTIRIQ